MNKKETREYVKKHFVNPFKVGDIIHHSWGYGQTQADFYQVVKLTDKTVTVRAIGAKTVEGSEAYMSRRAMPVKDNFLTERLHSALVKHCDGKEEIRKRISAYVQNDGTLRYYIPTPYGWASKWDGNAKYNSWYH